MPKPCSCCNTTKGKRQFNAGQWKMHNGICRKCTTLPREQAAFTSFLSFTAAEEQLATEEAEHARIAAEEAAAPPDTLSGWLHKAKKEAMGDDAEASAYHFAVPGGTHDAFGDLDTIGNSIYGLRVRPWRRDGYVSRKDGSWRIWDVDKRTVTSVSIPSSVTCIGEDAFEGCVALRHVCIPASVTSIKKRAFFGCVSLISVAIPPHVTRIEEWAFSRCRSLKSVRIPASVTDIGKLAFRGCWSLTRVDIPAYVTRIDECAFDACMSLTRVDIPASVATIRANAFSSCRSLRSVAIPASVTNIDRDAFEGCWSLRSVVLPASVPAAATNMKAYGDAFRNCDSLAVLMVEPACDAAAPAASATAPGTHGIGAVRCMLDLCPTVTKIWATDSVIAGLKGRFEAYSQFKDVPRAHRAAPDATTWAGVQLWLWWLPPSSFSVGGNGVVDPDCDNRVVCKSRQNTIWVTQLSAHKASEVLEMLPDLEPELWEHIFTFLKHDQQPD